MNTAVTCRDGVLRLMDYLEGVLDEPTHRAFDAHLAACPRCVAFVRSYRATAAILRAATHVTLPASARDSLRRALSGRRR